MAMASLLCEVGVGVLNPNFVCNHLGAFGGIYLGLGVYEIGAGSWV